MWYDFHGKGVRDMAKNTGNGYREGRITGRTQFENPKTGHFTERDTSTGKFTNVKHDEKPFKKDVRREK